MSIYIRIVIHLCLCVCALCVYLAILYFLSNGKMLMLNLESNYNKLKVCSVSYYFFFLIAPSNLFLTLPSVCVMRNLRSQRVGTSGIEESGKEGCNKMI